MDSWKKLLYRTDLTEEELQQIPCTSNNINSILYTFYQNQNMFQINIQDVLKGLPYSFEEYIDTNKWTDALSAVKIVYNSFFYTSEVLSHKICYKIGQSFINSKNNLFKIFFTLLPITTIVKQAYKQNEKFANTTILDVIHFKKGYALLKNKPYPYYKEIGPGVNCHLARGIISAFFDLHEINEYSLKELFCTYKIQNIIKNVYARLNWKCSEDEEYVYLNGDKIARKVRLKLQKVYGKEIYQPEIDEDNTEYNAVQLIKDINYNGLEIFKENEIYNAPYCLFEFSWKPNSLYKRIKTLIKKRFEFKYVSVKEMQKQIEFSNQKLFEALENKKLAIESLKKADRLKDEFLANTAHELRNPLNGIIGLVESFMGDNGAESLNSDQKENLSMIITSAKRLSNLVNDILDYSKLKNKEIKLQLKSLDIRQITEVTFKMLEPLLKGRPIIFKNKIPNTFPFVKGDESRLTQIMYNLIGNAIKFTEEGAIEVNAKENGRFVEITVSDEGIGIPQNKLEAIFDSFEQVDELLDKTHEGTGIGLYVTRKLVKLHGGTIRVESELKKGSRFTFSLLKGDEQKEDPEANVPMLLQTEENYTKKEKTENWKDETNESIQILAVDDDPINLHVLSNLLSSKYKVVTSTSGAEALNFINNHHSRPDLVLLDIMMPRISGFEVCTEIRKRYSIEELPIIIISAKDRTFDLVKGFQSGANDYLLKPLLKEELLARVDMQIKLKQSIEKDKIRLQELFHTDKLLSLGLISSEVAHEINNPNNRIITNANLLSKSYPYIIDILDNYLEEKGDFQLGKFNYSEIQELFPALFSGIINSAERIEKIVKNLKSFARKEPENIIESIDINEVVKSAVELISPLIKKSTDHFTTEYALNLSRINGNSLKLEQVLVNLLQNACQSLKDTKGSIKVSTCFDQEENVIVEIEDEGVGMDDETLKRIKEPFWSTKIRSGGMGLGLYISSKIVEEHNGKLIFTSIPNKGTKAMLSLPVIKNFNSNYL